MEKDNGSNEGSSDYSCSPVTKNELLTAAKYRAIKFAIVLAPAIPIPLFHFICSKPLSRLLRVLHQHRVTGETKNERKFHLLPLLYPHFPTRVFKFLERDSSLLSRSLHSLRIIYYFFLSRVSLLLPLFFFYSAIVPFKIIKHDRTSYVHLTNNSNFYLRPLPLLRIVIDTFVVYNESTIE